MLVDSLDSETNGEEVAYLKGYLWDSPTSKSLFNTLEKILKSPLKESQERCFTEFVLELQHAYRIFLRKIQDLPMIMKCRVKCADASHFGGMECGELMSAYIDSASKYLKKSKFPKNDKNNPVTRIVCAVRDKAKRDEKYAWEFENKAKENYITYGKDNTLNILISGGYDIQSN